MAGTSLNDGLNLKDSILTITTFIRDKGGEKAEPRTLLRFLELLFNDVFDKKERDSCIRDFQKLFSGNIQPQKLADTTASILQGSYDSALRKNLEPIAATLAACDEQQTAFDVLLRLASPVYFQLDELQRLEDYRRKHEYAGMLLQIIKHGFQDLTAIPCFFAQRAYEEALTYDYDQPMRFELMKAAAECGNKQAALEYGNYLNRWTENGPENAERAGESFTYTLMALPLPSAMWNLAWLLENLQLNSEQLRQLSTAIRIDEKLASSDFDPYRYELELVSCPAEDFVTHDSIMLAYKICFYLAHRGFSKAFNSLGKYCDDGFTAIEIKESGRFGSNRELAMRYYQKAIAGGNVLAMYTVGSKLLKQLKDGRIQRGDVQEKYMLTLLKTSASFGVMRSYMRLGEYYMDVAAIQDDPVKVTVAMNEAKSYLGKAEALGGKHAVFYRLGCLSKNKQDKVKYFTKALESGYYDAAYQLALIAGEEYSRSGSRYNLLHAIAGLDANTKYMSPEVRQQAEEYWKILEQDFGSSLSRGKL